MVHSAMTQSSMTPSTVVHSTIVESESHCWLCPTSRTLPRSCGVPLPSPITDPAKWTRIVVPGPGSSGSPGIVTANVYLHARHATAFMCRHTRDQHDIRLPCRGDVCIPHPRTCETPTHMRLAAANHASMNHQLQSAIHVGTPPHPSTHMKGPTVLVASRATTKYRSPPRSTPAATPAPSPTSPRPSQTPPAPPNSSPFPARPAPCDQSPLVTPAAGCAPSPFVGTPGTSAPPSAASRAPE